MSIVNARAVAESMTSPYEEDQTVLNDLVGYLAEEPGQVLSAEDVEEAIKLAEHLEDEAVDARLRGEAIWLGNELRKP